MTYKSKEFKALKEDVDNIYLNEEEINELIDLDLTDSKKLDQARICLLLGVTGLRF